MNASPDAPRRAAPRVVIDIVVSVVLLAFGAVLALIVLGYATLYNGLTAGCGRGPFEGIQCNATVLSITVFALMAVTILSYFLAVGMVIVSLIRKRLTFWWPLGGVIVIIAAFYIATWIAGMVAPAGAGS
ncbi:DUF6264 family protein [Salinibacterium sp. G-O1]|uniref:DUF6264 family protein n=1 Tax=Salinibacterium sp. G-O1 TaxID=3046208 RepID=UPI0024BA2659|nr:DUF6264 family protein [Salinibacterium sp. G-O1]MDJ0334744.1 DUF6264 family protein [Salinibacterium sp. G-O1]